MMRLPFESEEAQQLNRDIFETIYYSALRTSCELAELHGPYETYEGSPVSHGVSIAAQSALGLCHSGLAGVVVQALDLQSAGGTFDPCSPSFIKLPGQFVHACVPLSSSSITEGLRERTEYVPQLRN